MTDTRMTKIKKRYKHKDKKFKTIESEIDISIHSNKTIGPEIIKNILANKKALFLSLLAFRLVNSLMIQTASVPDEYWQSVEVAHKLVFNIGYLTWEWLPEIAIRSPIYPLMFALPFKLLQLLNLDSRIVLIKIPMLIQAVLASIGDFYLYKLTFLYSGQQAAQWTLFNYIINWFGFYSLCRTLINNIECLLVILALYQYCIISKSQSLVLNRKFIMISLFSFLIRPTGALVLVPIGVYHLGLLVYNYKLYRDSMNRSIYNGVVVAIFGISLSLLCDKHFYGRWTCSQWNFFQFNLLTDVSNNYGVHSYHWYWTSALPTILATQLVGLAMSLILIGWNKMWSLMIIVIQIYSYVGHKEFRFIMSLLPVAMVIIGEMYTKLSPRYQRWLAFTTVVSQVPLCAYLCLIHQRGCLDTVLGLGRHIDRSLATIRADSTYLQPSNISVLFLMPCHSTPWTSHIHYNISMRFLRCDPQILWSSSPSNKLLPLQNYDEADEFYANPDKWLLHQYNNNNSSSSSIDLPSFIVIFDSLLTHIHDLVIDQWQYSVCHTHFHTHLPMHSRHSTRILILCAPNQIYLSN